MSIRSIGDSFLFESKIERLVKQIERDGSMSKHDRRNLVGAVLVGIRRVKAMTGYRSTSTIYDKMKNANFPQSIRLRDGSGTVRWIEFEIQEWIDEQIRASCEAYKQQLIEDMCNDRPQTNERG